MAPTPAHVQRAPAPPRGAAVSLAPGLLVLGGVAVVVAIAIAGPAELFDPLSEPTLTLAIPGVAVTTLLALRMPVAAMAAIAATAAFSGALGTNYEVPVETLNWFFVIGLIAATILSHALATRYQRFSLWPGLALLGGFVVLALSQIPFAESTEIGLRAFLAGPLYILIAFTVAYALWREETRWRVMQALIVISLLAGLYALYRQAVGPSAAEAAVARRSAGVGGELALFGSLPNRLQLGTWCAIAAPALLTLALATRGRWRLLSTIAFALTVVALLGSQVRTALLAALAGIALALILFQRTRSFGRVRMGAALVALVGLLIAGGIGYAVTVADSPDKTERFERILSPGSDFSFQRRMDKWDQALDEINAAPFGQGLGTAGSTQRRYSRYQRLDNFYIDNSYLEIGVQLGYPGLLLLVLGALLLLLTLARRSVFTSDPRAAALGVGASGALLAWLVEMMTGGTYEAWGALLLWILLGLGIGSLMSSRAGVASRAA